LIPTVFIVEKPCFARLFLLNKIAFFFFFDKKGRRPGQKSWSGIFYCKPTNTIPLSLPPCGGRRTENSFLLHNKLVKSKKPLN
jgi:hypothetical protein